MGYDLHITRRQDWSDKGDDITSADWMDYIRRHPEWQLMPENGPHFAVMGDESEPEKWWLDWRDGALFAKNPDEALLDKMLEVAREFGAVVQGDDGEIYDDDHSPE